MSSERIPKTYTQNLQGAVRLGPEKLCGIHRGVRSEAPGEIDRIAHMRLAGGAIPAGRPHFASHPNRRRRFEVVATKNAHRVERLQLGSRRGIRKSIR